MADKVKLDHDWLEQAIESSGRHFMEVEPCPACKGTGKRRTKICKDYPDWRRSINEQLIDRPCPNCKEGWIIK